MTTTPTEFDPKEDPELFEIATLASAIDTRRAEISELQEQLDEKVIDASTSSLPLPGDRPRSRAIDLLGASESRPNGSRAEFAHGRLTPSRSSHQDAPGLLRSGGVLLLAPSRF